MREEFEKLPHIADKLHTVVFNEQFNDYHAAMINSSLCVYYVRGAWYTYQEQQKKIDAVLKHINKKCDEFCETHDMDNVALLEEIEDILK